MKIRLDTIRVTFFWSRTTRCDAFLERKKEGLIVG